MNTHKNYLQNSKLALTNLIIFTIILILISFTSKEVNAVPQPVNVIGKVFLDTMTGAPNGVPIILDNLNISQRFYTATNAPPIPQLAGSYSVTINGSEGDLIQVRAYNSTNYGETTLPLGSGSTEINVTMNNSRPSETNVTITAPMNNTVFDEYVLVNITVNISVLGKNATGCNVTLILSNASAMTTALGANYTNDVGNISLGETKTTIFEMRTNDPIKTNITAVGACSTDGINLFNVNSSSVYNITINDTAPPNVTLSSPPDFQERGAGLVDFSYVPYDYNLDNCTLYLGSNNSFTPYGYALPINNQTNTFYSVNMDVGVHPWNVYCMDTKGNGAFATQNFTLNVTPPDIFLNYSRIYFSSGPYVEGENVTVFANISNIGLTDVTQNFIVSFYKGDPNLGGELIGNKTASSLNSGAVITLNETFNLSVGTNNVFVVADSGNTINETDENNNVANNSVIVPIYQIYYGNITNNIFLGDSQEHVLIDFLNISENKGNVYFADADSSFSFADLQAIDRDSSGNSVSNDFSDIDTNLNITSFDDSIKNTWGNGTNTPIKTDTFNITNLAVHNVPVVNSTDVSSFETGILWDAADDTSLNSQYDTTDKEDLVFITKVLTNTLGKYGTYDYEIKIPAALKSYKVGTDKLVFYTELN